MITASGIIKECTPYYDRDADTERVYGDYWEPTPLDMDQIARGDYDLECYYPVPAETEFPDRSSAIATLSAVYVGADVHGIGWRLPAR